MAHAATRGASGATNRPRRLALTAQNREGAGSSTRTFDASRGGGTFPAATGFWDNQANLMKYDIVIFSCEGQTFSATKPDSALNALHDYANAGGRVFATHYHYTWFKQNPEADFRSEKRSNETHASTTDPDASSSLNWMNSTRAFFGNCRRIPSPSSI